MEAKHSRKKILDPGPDKGPAPGKKTPRAMSKKILDMMVERSRANSTGSATSSPRRGSLDFLNRRTSFVELMSVQAVKDDANFTKILNAFLAAWRNDVDLIENYAKSGGDIEVVESMHQRTLCHSAASGDAVEVVAALCARGVCLDGLDDEGNTPFELAITRDSQNVVAWFLENRAEEVVTAAAASVAAGAGALAVVQWYVENRGLQSTKRYRRRWFQAFLAQACEGRRVAVLEYLLGCLPEKELARAVNRTDDQGNTILHRAAAAAAEGGGEEEPGEERFAVVGALLACPAVEPAPLNKRGHAPLVAACEAGGPPAAEALLGFQRVRRSVDVLSAVLAAKLECWAVPGAYLRGGGDPNASVRSEPRTLLVHLAAARGHLPTLRLLVKFKTKVDVKDASGKTPLMHLCINKHEEAAEWFFHYAGPSIPNEAVIEATQNGWRWLLEERRRQCGGDGRRAFGGLFRRGRSLPHLAAALGDELTAAYLVAALGAAQGARDPTGVTAAQAVLEHGAVHALGPLVRASLRVRSHDLVEEDIPADTHPATGHTTPNCGKALVMEYLREPAAKARGVSLARANFLPWNTFIRHGNIPRYDEVSNDLVSGGLIRDGSRVLYVSHLLWHHQGIVQETGAENPRERFALPHLGSDKYLSTLPVEPRGSPRREVTDTVDEQHQLKTILEFVKGYDGPKFDYIWLGSACLDLNCHLAESDSFFWESQFQNIITAVCLSSVVLGIPSISEVGESIEKGRTAWASNMWEFADSAWVELETVGALLSGAEHYLGVSFAEALHFKLLGAQRHQLRDAGRSAAEAFGAAAAGRGGGQGGGGGGAGRPPGAAADGGAAAAAADRATIELINNLFISNFREPTRTLQAFMDFFRRCQKTDLMKILHEDQILEYIRDNPPLQTLQRYFAPRVPDAAWARRLNLNPRASLGGAAGGGDAAAAASATGGGGGGPRRRPRRTQAQLLYSSLLGLLGFVLGVSIDELERKVVQEHPVSGRAWLGRHSTRNVLALAPAAAGAPPRGRQGAGEGHRKVRLRRRGFLNRITMALSPRRSGAADKTFWMKESLEQSDRKGNYSYRCKEESVSREDSMVYSYESTSSLGTPTEEKDGGDATHADHDLPPSKSSQSRSFSPIALDSIDAEFSGSSSSLPKRREQFQASQKNGSFNRLSANK